MENWQVVEEYLDGKLVPCDDALESTLQAGVAAGLPQIQVTWSQGKLLYLLARIQGARRVLEIGTLAGFSAIWLARALPPDGQVVSLEIDPLHADVARENVRRAGVESKVEIRLGPALDTLRSMVSGGADPFDLVFIDADKGPSREYLELALRLSRPGTVIVVDNVVRQGAVAHDGGADPAALGIRAMLDSIAANPGLEATAIQTVGSKGYDGFALIRVA